MLEFLTNPLLGAFLAILALGQPQSTRSQAEPKPMEQQCRLIVELQKRRTNGSGLETSQESEEGVLVAPDDEPVWIKATLRNVSKSPVTVSTGPIEANMQVQVRTADGHLAPLTALGKRMQAARAPENRTGMFGYIGRIATVTLDPGQEVSQYVQVDREYDMTLGGIFRIRAKYPYSSGIAVSAPLQLNLKPPQSPIWLVPSSGTSSPH